ncbi:E3 ubiquitin-protein ligase RNF183 [Myotis yumanensis]|uniref:E3 ubiquitin-protein ligase RNF183 n=1 Tax=Myotis yumanensis TaxID=159337 RepID=UPI0038D41ADC
MAEQQGGEPECPVCCNPFDNTFHTPKVLDCGHSFCVECLAHLSLVTPAQHQLLCPLCRQPTVLASGRPVTDLPTDTAKLTLLCLEPHHVILEGHQLFLEDQPKSCSFLRQLQVYTLDVGPEPRSQTEDPQVMAPEPRNQTEDPQAMAPTTTPQANPIPTCYSPREYLQYPELPEAYLKAAILSITLLFIVCIVWVIQFCGV